MTSGSGRCHGPGCTQTAVVAGGFCGEVCQDRWHGQYDTTITREVRVRIASWTDPATIERLRQQVGELAALRDSMRAASGGGLATAAEPVEDEFEAEPEFEDLPPAVDGDTEDRTCVSLSTPLATIDSVRRDEDGLHVTGRWLPVGSGAGSPQVASDDLQVGWFRRWLDRLAGRHP